MANNTTNELRGRYHNLLREWKSSDPVQRTESVNKTKMAYKLAMNGRLTPIQAQALTSIITATLQSAEEVYHAARTRHVDDKDKLMEVESQYGHIKQLALVIRAAVTNMTLAPRDSGVSADQTNKDVLGDDMYKFVMDVLMSVETFSL